MSGGSCPLLLQLSSVDAQRIWRDVLRETLSYLSGLTDSIFTIAGLVNIKSCITVFARADFTRFLDHFSAQLAGAPSGR